MSKKNLLLAGVAAAAIAGAIHLGAQSPMAADSAGVTVNLNGLQLMHRSPVAYPAEALSKGVEGAVVVQVRLDAKGEVIDDAILSGPDELRRGLQQSVLDWHFDKSAASSTRVVNIDFAKPASTAATATGPIAATRAQVFRSVPAQPVAMSGQSMNAAPGRSTAMAERQLSSIEIFGLSDSAREQLLAILPVHVGDNWSEETMMRVAEAARKFDEHLSVSGGGSASGTYSIRIKTPDASVTTTNTAPPMAVPAGAQRIGGNVMAANLVSQVPPVYPPLAKMARQQGTVKFQATIGTDGKVEALQVISGPPLLVQASVDAVKKWVYQPTLLNGAPVEVVTTVDVNFTLADGGTPAQ